MTTPDAYLDDRQDQSLAELQELLRIPSISALPEHEADVQRAAQWVAARLRRADLEGVQVMPTGGHPVVYGQWLQAPGTPTILIYGHFDVQPVDPVDLWTTGPFAAEVRDGRIYNRGASDMKGDLFSTILAVESLLQVTGSLPVNIKFLLEGQEEIGSPQLAGFVAQHRDLLVCDLAVSADGSQLSEDQPSLTIGLRGLCKLEIDVQGAATDLHSGQFGGAIHNPIHALVRLLDSMHAPDGTVLVEGFYDDVRPLTPEDRERIAAIPFDEEEYRADIGVPELFGEPGYTPLERSWRRPTLEINGIWGGFQGEGTKTVIPSEAHAKITCRLVPDQDPEQVAHAIVRHVERNTPPGVRARVTSLGDGARAYLMAADHPGNVVAAEVLTGLYGREPVYQQSGGSVPITEIFRSVLGVYTVSFSFGLPDEKFHAPDEFWRLSSFRRAQHAWVALLQRLGGETPESLYAS